MCVRHIRMGPVNGNRSTLLSLSYTYIRQTAFGIDKIGHAYTDNDREVAPQVYDPIFEWNF